MSARLAATHSEGPVVNDHDVVTSIAEVTAFVTETLLGHSKSVPEHQARVRAWVVLQATLAVAPRERPKDTKD